MANLLLPPKKFTLPLTKNRDLYCVFVYKPLVTDVNGNPILTASGLRQYQVANDPAGCTVKLVIDDGSTEGILVMGTITGSKAEFWANHNLVNGVKAGKLWRVVIRYTNELDDVLCQGTITREDGK